MPGSGESNTLFGVFKSDCCEAEIVIVAGADFPTCPYHRERRTTWIPIEVGPDDLIVLSKERSKAESAA